MVIRRVCALFMFQFTHPGRGATEINRQLASPWMFQFTHPGRGATGLIPVSVRDEDVSIHAPREGCDSVVQSCVL